MVMGLLGIIKHLDGTASEKMEQLFEMGYGKKEIFFVLSDSKVEEWIEKNGNIYVRVNDPLCNRECEEDIKINQWIKSSIEIYLSNNK